MPFLIRKLSTNTFHVKFLRGKKKLFEFFSTVIHLALTKSCVSVSHYFLYSPGCTLGSQEEQFSFCCQSVIPHISIKKPMAKFIALKICNSDCLWVFNFVKTPNYHLSMEHVWLLKNVWVCFVSNCVHIIQICCSCSFNLVFLFNVCLFIVIVVGLFKI